MIYKITLSYALLIYSQCLSPLKLYYLFNENVYDLLYIPKYSYNLMCILPLEQNTLVQYIHLLFWLIIVTSKPKRSLSSILSLVTPNSKWNRILWARTEHSLTKTQLSHSLIHMHTHMQWWNGSDKTNYSTFHTKQEYIWGEHPAVVFYSSLCASFKHLLLQVRTKSAAALNCDSKFFLNLLEGSGDLRTRVQDFDKLVKSSYCPFFIKLSFPLWNLPLIHWRTASFHDIGIYQHTPPHSQQTPTCTCHQ